jgi:hypothetical protein
VIQTTRTGDDEPGEQPDPRIMRPEIANILIHGYHE